MAPTMITVEGVGSVKLSSEEGYHKWLDRQGVTSLIDDENCQIDFESLVNGAKYTLGPPQQLQPNALQQFELQASLPAEQNEFYPDGFGPFVVQRKKFREEVIENAGPRASYHISGCKGSGKTTVLRLIGRDLVAAGKKVYYLKGASVLTRLDVQAAIDDLVAKHVEAYFLVDESQTVGQAVPIALITLLKNDCGHNLTTIGAGVPAFHTLSATFTKSASTNRLFLSESQLTSEGVITYFGPDSKVSKVLLYIRNHCGGHIYPLMRAMELLRGHPDFKSLSAEELIQHYESSEFRKGQEYKTICGRILPEVTVDEIRPLFYLSRQPGSLQQLERKGFVAGGKVLSHLLLDAYIGSLDGSEAGCPVVKSGLKGITTTLIFSLKRMKWAHYDSHGGPIEDALSFELLFVMAQIPQLSTRLFNPKLVDVGTRGRRPDIYINSLVNSYIECVLTNGHTETDTAKLDMHLKRFCAEDDTDPHYQLLDSQDYAVLNFQTTGTAPLNPSDPYSALFAERVFTFIMCTKQIFLGKTLIG